MNKDLNEIQATQINLGNNKKSGYVRLPAKRTRELRIVKNIYTQVS